MRRALTQNYWFVHATPLLWVNDRSIGKGLRRSTTPRNATFPILYAHYIGDDEDKKKKAEETELKENNIIVENEQGSPTEGEAKSVPPADTDGSYYDHLHWGTSLDPLRFFNILRHPNYQLLEAEKVVDKTGHMIRVQQKPWRLMAELILRFSDPGQLVVDPFAGTGSTGLAALATGRKFMGCDNDGPVVEAANKRLANHRGKVHDNFDDFWKKHGEPFTVRVACS